MQEYHVVRVTEKVGMGVSTKERPADIVTEAINRWCSAGWSFVSMVPVERCVASGAYYDVFITFAR